MPNRKSIFAFVTMAFSFAAALAQPAAAQSITACDQTVQYKMVAPAADVSDTMRKFSGLWVGSWASQLCHVLIVEEISKDGNVIAKYVHGANPGWGIRQPGVRQWSGKVNGNTLSFKGNTVSVDYKLVDGATLTGAYTYSGGQTSGTFKKQ